VPASTEADSNSAKLPNYTPAQPEQPPPEEGELCEATTGSLLQFPAPVVTSEKPPVVTGDYSPPVVTGDYSAAKPAKAKSSKQSQRRPAKPKIPGCEVKNEGAGWKVFRYWYEPKKPGQKWPKKRRAYETYLTQDDVRGGLKYGKKK
jgi:hypothetical protein